MPTLPATTGRPAELVARRRAPGRFVERGRTVAVPFADAELDVLEGTPR